MLILGIIGYGLRKFGCDPATLVLGMGCANPRDVAAPIVISRTAMDDLTASGPIAYHAARRYAARVALARVAHRSRKDWRSRLAEAETAKPSRASRRQRSARKTANDHLAQGGPCYRINPLLPAGTRSAATITPTGARSRARGNNKVGEHSA